MYYIVENFVGTVVQHSLILIHINYSSSGVV